MGWYEAIKDVVTVADRLKDAELKNRLADVQAECAKLAEENARLRTELLDLREQVQTRQEMLFQNNVYWRQSKDKQLEGPYCPKCFDGSNKPARMTEPPNWHNWLCPVCNCAVAKPGGRSLPDRAVTDFDSLNDSDKRTSS